MSCFEIAIQVEETIAEIYGQLSSRFVDDAELRALFALLKQEELGHARRICRLRDHMSYDAMAGAMAYDDRTHQTILDETETILGTIILRPAISAQEALGLALDVEHRFCEMHADALARRVHPEFVPFFEELSRGDVAHVRILPTLAESRL